MMGERGEGAMGERGEGALGGKEDAKDRVLNGRPAVLNQSQIKRWSSSFPSIRKRVKITGEGGGYTQRIGRKRTREAQQVFQQS